MCRLLDSLIDVERVESSAAGSHIDSSSDKKLLVIQCRARSFCV